MGEIRSNSGLAQLHEGCPLRQLPEEDREHAVEVGKAIAASPEHAAKYGQTLLALNCTNAISLPQSDALIECLKNITGDKCPGFSA